MNSEEKMHQFLLDMRDFFTKQVNVLKGEDILVEMRLKTISMNLPSNITELLDRTEEAKKILFEKGKIEGKMELLDDFSKFLDEQIEKID